MTSDPAPPPDRRTFPWYDSVWLETYTEATETLARVRPAELPTFVDAFLPLRTRSDFEVVRLDQVFEDTVLQQVRDTVASLRPSSFSLHEVRTFGRFLLHDHPAFTDLQQGLVPRVADVVGEPVEVSYNFLSLYTNLGVCPVHMDSPQAKWTLDLCIDQSTPWPIHLSDLQPWPDPPGDAGTPAPEWPANWEDEIKRNHRFTPHVLEPGQAIVFSGSSQWHYRDAIPTTRPAEFCDLLFFHFVPLGTRELVDPTTWATRFGVPELASLPSLSHHRSRQR